jgi:peptidoglycan hydrolase-like protein with peptidoglycan-binding domain
MVSMLRRIHLLDDNETRQCNVRGGTNMSYETLIRIPSNINPGLGAARQATMLSLLGPPRSNYSQTCQPVTNPQLARQIATTDVGPFRATGFRPALADLVEIFKQVHEKYPEIYAALRSDGMLCARYVRGSTTNVSNHSWGTAIDLYLDGTRDIHGDGQVLSGLADIAPIFNAHGWYWGAGFGVEDGMHFEPSDQRIREYLKEGKIEADGAFVEDDNLGLGDRGPEVKALQEQLTKLGFETKADGSFGPLTQAALRALQAKQGLRATGVLDLNTLTALKELEQNHSIPGNPVASPAAEVLRLGSKGAQVTEWQNVLLSAGHAEVGVASGVFDEKTLIATKAFQQKHGLVVDGVVGPKTRACAAESTGRPQGTPPAQPLRRLANKDLTADIIRQAPVLLCEHFKEPIGTQIPFTSDGKKLVGVLEWHFNERLGKHKGFSVFVPS